MFKKIVLFALLLIPMGAFAQEKIAYVNTMEVMLAMPEMTDMQNKLQAQQEAVQLEMKTIEEEYAKKYQALMDEGENLVESIRIRRLQEIQDLEQRAQTFAQQSQEQLQQLYQNLLTPIQEKVQTALKKVGDANNFAYILDVSAGGTIVYVNPNSLDATPLLKKELGL